MTLKEKITQVILDLNKESIKYPRMKTTDVTYMLSIIISKDFDCEEKEQFAIDFAEWVVKTEAFDDYGYDEAMAIFKKDNKF